MPQTTKSKYWCITNNFQEDGTVYQVICHNARYRELVDLLGNGEIVQYACGQFERGTNGTLHYQGYICFVNRKEFNTVRNLPGLNGAHLERRRGTHEEAKAYCIDPAKREQGEDSELAGPFEYGDDSAIPKGPGARLDLEAVHSALEAGASDEQISDEHFAFFIRYHTGLSRYRQLHPRAGRTTKPIVTVFYGETGSGKSYLTRQASPNAYWVIRPQGTDNLWFDGVGETQDIIFDDFYSWMRLDFFLRICDANPMLLKIHGGLQNWTGGRIFFTSNEAPENWYPGVSDVHRRAYLRRIENIIFFPEAFREGQQPHYEIKKGELPVFEGFYY